jgi:hypothetical protein
MKLIASLLITLVAACASTPTPTTTTATPAHEPPAPAPMPKQMSRAELDRRLAAGELKPIALTEISGREISVLDANKGVERPNELVLTNAVPNGWSQTVFADRYRRLWIASAAVRAHVPPNVIISATRVFETRFEIPIGYRVVGSFAIVDATD